MRDSNIMEKKFLMLGCAAVLCLVAACGGDDEVRYGTFGPSDMLSPGVSSSVNDLTTSEELFNFDVAFDESFLSEQESSAQDDEDLVENTSFAHTVSIQYNGDGATWNALPEGVSIVAEGAKLTLTAATDENIIYSLSGYTTDGMFKLYSDKKCAISLSGLTMRDSDGPAINIQSKKRVFIVVEENTVNNLSDGSTYTPTDEDAKGVIFSEGQLVFSGGGRLSIEANCKAGVSSDQYLRFRRGNVIDVAAAEGNAVRGKDSIIISGGVLNIDVSGRGNKGLKSDGPVYINGGRTTILNAAEAYYDTEEADTKGPAGINSDGDIYISGGELAVKALGTGGKGITADGEMSIVGGKVRIITTGTKFSYGSSGGFGGGGPNNNRNNSSDNTKSPKGIRAEGGITITGGDIMSRTTGGSGSEAIESKNTLTISGGSVQAYAYDDAINSSTAMYLSGGNVWAVSYNNDGIDSNGNMYISGGTIIAFGLGEDGVDVIERGTLSITGGTLFSLGNTYMTSPSSSSQQSITRSVSSLTSGSAVTLADSDGSILFNYTMPFTIGRAYMILSVPTLARGNSYTFSIGSSSEYISL